MKKFRIAIFILVALAQLAVPGSMIWKREQTFRLGRLWKFRTAPVDPEDAIRGRYLSLRFTAEDFPMLKSPPNGGPAYIFLKEDAEGFAAVDRAQANAASGDNVVRVDRFWQADDKAHVRFPFDKFWVSEGNATAADNAYFAHSNRKQMDAYVTVRVRDGDAGIEDLFFAGQPLREYLRAHSGGKN